MTPENITPSTPSPAPAKKSLAEKQVEHTLVIIIIGLALITLVGIIVWLFTSQRASVSPTAFFTKNYETGSTETSGTAGTENLAGVPSEQVNETIGSAPSSGSAPAPQAPASSGFPSATPAPTYARPQPNLSGPSGPAAGGGAAATTPTPTPALTTIVSQSSSGTFANLVANAECPSGTTLVGGGFDPPAGSWVWQSYPSGNTWHVDARVNEVAGSVKAVAQCVSNLPGTVLTHANTATLADGASTFVTATCPSGQTIVSGGFNADKVRVFFSNKVENAWRIGAKNTSGEDRQITVSAQCYTGNVTTNTVLHNEDVPAGTPTIDTISCSFGMLIMGGYSFNSPVTNSFYRASEQQWVFLTANTGTSTARLKTYGYCATF